MDPDVLRDVAAIVAAVIYLLFPCCYAYLSHGEWMRSLPGRLIMLHGAGHALILVWFASAALWNPPVFTRAFAWVLIVAIGLVKLIALFRVQLRGADHGGERDSYNDDVNREEGPHSEEPPVLPFTMKE